MGAMARRKARGKARGPDGLWMLKHQMGVQHSSAIKNWKLPHRKPEKHPQKHEILHQERGNNQKTSKKHGWVKKCVEPRPIDCLWIPSLSQLSVVSDVPLFSP